jgi:hypothetical protein
MGDMFPDKSTPTGTKLPSFKKEGLILSLDHTDNNKPSELFATKPNLIGSLVENNLVTLAIIFHSFKFNNYGPR